MEEIANQKDSSRIATRAQDFPQWYLDVIAAADLAEHSGVKGAMIIKPSGYALWENIQSILDKKIKETGHKNAYFPLLIPESYLKREADHVEGFSPELAVVTHAGGEKLEEPLVIRPTSETIINASFSKWIQSWRDLPLLINQWANVVRWELRPRLFLRTTEFLWQEGHTAHATNEEAETEARKMLDVYHDLAENYLAIPVIAGQKTETEKFAGAVKSYSIEALMQDGKALQCGTSHNLGQNFAKVFDVKFSDKDGELKYVWQTSWGVSTRLIGGLIMTHSDDDGLVLPPKIAPVQVVIVPIGEVSDKAREIEKELLDADVRVYCDNRDHHSTGYKFNDWEKKGVPIRLEIGIRDINNNQVVVARRDTKEKNSVSLDGIVVHINQLLEEIQANLYHRARSNRENQTHTAIDFDHFKQLIEAGGFVWAGWCNSSECEQEVTRQTKATIRCIPFDQTDKTDQCLNCKKPAQHKVIYARAY